MSSEDFVCVLRADTSRSPRKVTTGMSAVMTSQTDATLHTKVAQIGYEKNGIAYADIAINADDFGTLGGTDNLMTSGLPIQLRSGRHYHAVAYQRRPRQRCRVLRVYGN